MKLRYPTLQFVIVSRRISLKSLDKTNFKNTKTKKNKQIIMIIIIVIIIIMLMLSVNGSQL